ncbi:sensor domain-containing protein [Nautilia sp.]
MIKKIKLIALITGVIFFFILFLFFEIKHLESEKIKYDEFKNKLYKIESLNKNLNFFIFGEKKVYNLDKVNSNITSVKNCFEEIKKNSLYYIYKRDIEGLEKAFLKKEALIERYKAYNAINLSTVVYLIDLAKKFDLKNDELRKKIDFDIFSLFKTYLGLNVNNVISKNAHISGNLGIFYDFLVNLKEKLNEINEIREKIKDLKFDVKIQNFIEKFEKDEESKFETTEYILKILQSVFVILLLIYIYIFIKIFTLQEKLYVFKLMVEKSDNSVLLISPSFKVLFANEMFYKKSGFKPEEIMGKNAFTVLKSMFPEKVFERIKFHLHNKTGYKTITKTYSRGFRKFYEKIVLLPIYQEKEFLGFTFLKSDLTEEVKKQKELEYLAYHDALTGLYNREKLKQDIKKCKREYCLFYMDLDEFKLINESFSHDFGDEVIVNVAKTLKKYSKYVYRIGGDEFVFIGFEQPEFTAENVLRDLKKINFNKKIIELSVSIGIVKNDFKDYETLLNLAEYALKEAKKSREKFVLFNGEMYGRIKREIEIIKHLPSVIKNGELYVKYQPKINTKNMSVYSLEALVRWKNETLNEVFPDEFIPLAEEKNYITEIDMYVLNRACEDFKLFKNIYPDLQTVSVNLSGVDLIDKNIVSKIKDITEKYNIKPENIEFEITETSLIKNIEISKKILKKLKDEGFKIGIDDFGTGYSSLSYIVSLNPDIIKIDKTFVDEMEKDGNKIEMIKIIKYISEKLNLEVVIEGVESEEQLEILKRMNLFNIQGYFFSRPLEKERLIKFLKTCCKE